MYIYILYTFCAIFPGDISVPVSSELSPGDKHASSFLFISSGFSPVYPHAVNITSDHTF